jgi:quercetin dioxygenase-like cupin family protein
MSTKTKGVVRKAEAVVREPVRAGTSAEYQILLGGNDGMPNFAMRKFTMGAGGGMPRHTNAVEHEQYVLGGRARVTIGDDIHEVAAGSVLYIPAGVPHDYQVIEAPFEFLCMVPNKEDRVEIVEEPDRRP